MASFDNGHCADAAHSPDVGSSNERFLCQGDWYVLSMRSFHIPLLWKMMRGAGIWVLNSAPVPPSTPPPPPRPARIDLFVLAEWQVLYDDCVSFDCLCQWSEPTLSSLTVRHHARFRLMNGSTLHRSSGNSCLRCLTDPVNQHWSSQVVYHVSSCRILWIQVSGGRSFWSIFLMQLCKSSSMCVRDVYSRAFREREMECGSSLKIQFPLSVLFNLEIL